MKVSRRLRWKLVAWMVAWLWAALGAAAELRFTPLSTGPGFSFLSWDTEGSAQTKLNLLRAGPNVVFQIATNRTWANGGAFVVGTQSADGTIALGTAGKTELLWSARTDGSAMVWSLKNVGTGGGAISAIRVTLPFNPRMAATTVLPAGWAPPDGFSLPAILSAADFGQLLIRQTGTPAVAGRFTGSRPKCLIDVAFEIPTPPAGETVTLEFSPWQLAAPDGLDEAVWKERL